MATTIKTKVMMTTTRRQEHGGVELDRASYRSKNTGGVACQCHDDQQQRKQSKHNHLILGSWADLPHRGKPFDLLQGQGVVFEQWSSKRGDDELMMIIVGDIDHHHVMAMIMMMTRMMVMAMVSWAQTMSQSDSWLINTVINHVMLVIMKQVDY